MFTYDAGAELLGRGWKPGDKASVAPFAGAGAGGRSYSYRSQSTECTHNLAGYGSVDGELGDARVWLRLEARNYVTGLKALRGADFQRITGWGLSRAPSPTNARPAP